MAGTLDELIELVLASRGERPRRRGPVAGVLPHRRQERDQIGSKIAQDRKEHQTRDDECQQCGRREVPHRVTAGVGEAEEQEHRSEGEEQVPLEGNSQWERGGDEQMERHHQSGTGKCDNSIGGEQKNQRGSDLDEGSQDVADPAGNFGGAKVVGEVAVVRSLESLPRRVREHGRDHHGEVMAELGDAGTDPHGHDEQFEGDDHVDEGQEAEEQDRGKVLLAAGGDEDDLVS